MVKDILKLFAVFGIIGGIAVGPGLLENETEVLEPNLELPTVDTYDNLKRLVDDSSYERYYGFDFSKNATLSSDVLFDGAVNSTAESVSDYSTTNVQVQGVDEADLVKNDGKYLYHLLDRQLEISEIYPASSMKVVSTINYENDFSPLELYVEDDMLIVIGSEYKNTYVRHDEEFTRDIDFYGYHGEIFTQIIIYDIKDRANPKEVKTVEVSGAYNSSRKIEDALYLIAKKNINVYDFEDDYAPLPIYRDSAVSDVQIEVPYNEIKYFPDFKCSQYMITVGVDLSNLENEAEISTYLGNSDSIYSSKDNMYVTFNYYKNSEVDDEVALKQIITPYYMGEKATSIYRFKLENGKMNCKATGNVKGSILNQFSMDENNGYFRIATTVGSVTGVGDDVSKNNIYVLDMDLKTVGSIEDIAPGEKIYSVRYIGNRAYMVTFRKVDPLFVIDLSSPENPTILGKLKIPGYSDYLHPYDENHIIGFGKDVALVNDEDGSWGWTDGDGTAAYYQGMKIALFDVTNPEEPIEMWKEEIGDRGTESELLNNHKALLFSKDKNLLAFPIKVATVDKNKKNVRAWTYGETTFVGAYVYEFTLDKGFVLKAKLTDLTDEDWKKTGYYYYGDKSIDRLIYIDDVLYTISDFGYSAYSMDDFEKIGSLELN